MKKTRGFKNVPNILSSFTLQFLFRVLLFCIVMLHNKCVNSEDALKEHKLWEAQFLNPNNAERIILPQQQNTDKSEQQKLRANIYNKPLHHMTDERIPKYLQPKQTKYNIISPKKSSYSSSKLHSSTFQNLYKHISGRIKYNKIRFAKPLEGFSNILQNQDFTVRDEPKDRIFKGWEASLHEFPWMVKVKSFSNPDHTGRSRRTNCGGALLNHRWVVTARHCVTWSPFFGNNLRSNKGVPAQSVWVFLGSHGQFGEDGLSIPADKALGRNDYGRPLCKHNDGLCNLIGVPGFNADTKFTNDIALVRLSQHVEYSDMIKPINLPLINEQNNYYGYTAQVSGWGMQGPGKKGYFLKGAKLTIVDGAQTRGCNTQTGVGKMCAVSSYESGLGGSTCPGDSGSPLVTWDDQVGGWTLIGILSNGARSCFQGMPEVYTKVTSYVDWIQKTIELHDQYDIRNEDSYLFYPYFTSEPVEPVTTIRPQIETSYRIPRSIFSKLLQIFRK